jgi:thioester reductase-like protein
MRSDAVLITGTTGFVGMELLARYLERTERPVIALVRAGSDRGARARVEAVLGELFGPRAIEYADRVQAFRAELTAPKLGLSERRFQALARCASTIVHGAASVSFTLPLRTAREINADGTRRVLELAEQAAAAGSLDRYAHISTAYVAGTHRGRFFESDLDVGQDFHNTYEQSKYEAEQLVRSSGVPFTILRPSIVVGDRTSGWTAAFNVLYWPLKALARGLFEAVPASPSTPVDVVSIDYVADAIHALCESSGGHGATYHLTAGAKASTMGEIASIASRYFRKPSPRMLSEAEFARVESGCASPLALEGGRAYFPYFTVSTLFDDTQARSVLEPAGISVSPLRDYLGRLLDFATRSRWGKRPIARSEAMAPQPGGYGGPPLALPGAMP